MTTNHTHLQVHRFLILNLALADLLMGVYLTIYAFEHLHSLPHLEHADATPDHRKESLESMESASCLVMGVISFMSSQVSVTLLIVITYFRLKTTVNPFSVGTGSEQMRRAWLLTAATWIFWLLIALVPLVDADVITKRFNNFIRFSSGGGSGGATFCYADRKYPEVHYDFLRKVIGDVADACDIGTATGGAAALGDSPSWGVLVAAAKRLGLVAADAQVRYYGYYNERSVCTATYFAPSGAPSMPFTQAVVCFNLASFAFIIGAYAWIWKSSIDVKSSSGGGGGSCANSRKASAVVTARQKSPTLLLLPKMHQGAGGGSSLSLPRLSIAGARSLSVQHQKSRLGQQRNLENRRMQKRIFVMIGTDFLCWVPLCLMAVAFTIKTSTLQRHSTAYHEYLEYMYPILDTFTVLVLPINSSLNPFIYSTRFWQVAHAWILRSWKQRSKRQAQSPSSASGRDGYKHADNSRQATSMTSCLSPKL